MCNNRYVREHVHVKTWHISKIKMCKKKQEPWIEHDLLRHTIDVSWVRYVHTLHCIYVGTRLNKTSPRSPTRSNIAMYISKRYLCDKPSWKKFDGKYNLKEESRPILIKVLLEQCCKWFSISIHDTVGMFISCPHHMSRFTHSMFYSKCFCVNFNSLNVLIFVMNSSTL